MICEYGQRLTNAFNEFDEAIYRCKWYSLPLEAQQMLALLMTNTQQLAYMKSYGNVQCTRDTFKNVRTSILFFTKIDGLQ